MKIKSIFAAALSGVFAFAACQKTSDTPVTPSEKDNIIKFTASFYEFTKATDTAFEEGDQISVNIFNPECYLYNAQFTYTGGQLTSAVPYEWYEDTEVEATVTAMYPASKTMEGFAATQSFMVNADQSTKAGYAASDLLLATAKAYPSEEAVNLPFNHALSKIVVNVDNQLKEQVADVWFTDVLGEVSFSTADHSDLAATGSAGTIKAFKSGDNTWQLIVAPQTASPKLALTTVSGKQYTFVLSEDVTFSSGKVSTATVTVTAESIYTSFTPEITDWVADNDLNFSQGDENVELPEVDEPTLTACKLTIKVNKSIDWYDKYVYAWDASATLTALWPGTKAEWDKEDGDYYVYYHNFDASLNGATINYIINNGGTAQTKDLTVTLNGAETVAVIEATDVQ
jgi:hypothetical protein